MSGATKGGDGALMTSTRKEVEDHEGKFNASAAFLSMYLKSTHTNNYKQYQAVFSTVYTLSHRTQAFAEREPLSSDFQEVSFQLRYVAQRVHILSEVRHISSHGHINPRDLAWPKATASNNLEVTWRTSLSLTLNEMWPLRCQLSTVSVWPELMEVWAMPYQTPWIAMVVLQTGTACQACWQRCINTPFLKPMKDPQIPRSNRQHSQMIKLTRVCCMYTFPFPLCRTKHRSSRGS